MTDIEKIKRGLGNWLDAEILSKVDDNARDLLGVAIALKLNGLKADALADWLPMDDNGHFDLEAAAAVLLPRLRDKPMYFKMEGRRVPLIGELPGLNIKFTEQSLHDLLAYINRA